jgi:predicted CXXCH cytochrome family protein
MRPCAASLTTFGLTVLAATVLVFSLSSCGTVERAVHVPPTIEGATFVGNRTCADCHTNIARHFPGSAHGRFYREDAGMAGQTGCESCHGAGSKHVAAAGARQFIINPRKDPGACFACHLDTHAQFNLPQRHPVIEGKVTCVQCHDPHGADMLKPAGGLAMARQNATCAQCHRDQSRPFVFEHEALRDGCVACHQPHGSISPAMLVQRDSNLCLKCHAQTQATGGAMIGQVDHSAMLRLGACWSAGCHTAVHGSNVNPKMMY